jgi:hypothetical protein
MPPAPVIRTFGSRVAVSSVFDYDGVIDQVRSCPEVYGGSTDPRCTVELFIDGRSAGNAIVGERTPSGNTTYRWSGVLGPGSWMISLTRAVLSNVSVGHHRITAIATDVIGNRSIPSEPFLVITDGVDHPGAPQINTPLNGSRTNNISPTIAGLGKAPDTVVEVYVDGHPIGRTPTIPSSNRNEFLWSFTPSIPLVEGTHIITARTIEGLHDGMLRLSMSTPPLHLTIDTTAPTTRITSPSDNTRINSNTPTITGITSEFPSTVQLMIDGNFYGPMHTSSDGSWSFTIPPTPRLQDGVHDIFAKATDAIGNIGDPSPSINVITDVTPPRIVNTIPADSETGILTTDPISGTEIIVIFNEEMSSLPSGTFTVKNNRSGALVMGTTYLNTNRRTVTFNPFDTLEFSTTYIATITNGVKDLAGNHMTSDYQWSFTTEEAAPTIIDTTPPQIISTGPTDLARDVSITSSITAKFSEKMNNYTINADTFMVKDNQNNDVAGTVSLSDNDEVAIFHPNSDLALSTTYIATITNGVKDLAGNHMEADHKWSFTTEEKQFAITTSKLDSCIKNLEELVDWKQKQILTSEEFDKLKSALIQTLSDKSPVLNPAQLLPSSNTSEKTGIVVTDLNTKMPSPVESTLSATYPKSLENRTSTLTEELDKDSSLNPSVPATENEENKKKKKER